MATARNRQRLDSGGSRHGTDMLIGQLQGTIQGMLDSQDELKQMLRDHMSEEERLMNIHQDRIAAIEQKQAEERGKIWGLTAIASGGGVIGGIIHSVGEFFVRGGAHG